MTNIVRDFSDSEGAGAGTGWCVGAGVAWVPDVRGVGGDGGAAGGGGDDAADPEARGAPSVRVTSADARALGGAVADPSQAETVSQLLFDDCIWSKLAPAQPRIIVSWFIRCI